jgi:hypothetical protein
VHHDTMLVRIQCQGGSGVQPKRLAGWLLELIRVKMSWLFSQAQQPRPARRGVTRTQRHPALAPQFCFYSYISPPRA